MTPDPVTPNAPAGPPGPALARRLADLADQRRRALWVSEWIDEYHPDDYVRSGKLLRCCETVEFLVDDAGRFRSIGMRYCNLYRLCPMCAHRRAFRRALRIARRVRALVVAVPGAVAYLVTLTHGPTTDLSVAVPSLIRAVSDLHRIGQKARRERPTTTDRQSARVVGAVHFTEFHYDPSKWRPGKPLCWNVHSHAVWVCDRPVDAHALSAEWAALTGGPRVVDVRPLDACRDLAVPDPSRLFADARRVASYAQKHPEGGCRHIWEADRALAAAGRCPPLVTGYGRLRGPLPPDAADDPPHAGHGGGGDTFLSYRWEGGEYVSADTS